MQDATTQTDETRLDASDNVLTSISSIVLPADLRAIPLQDFPRHTNEVVVVADLLQGLYYGTEAIYSGDSTIGSEKVSTPRRKRKTRSPPEEVEVEDDEDYRQSEKKARTNSNERPQSGMIGVHWSTRPRGWAATWMNQGKRMVRYFPESTFGREEALKMAKQFKIGLKV